MKFHAHVFTNRMDSHVQGLIKLMKALKGIYLNQEM